MINKAGLGWRFNTLHHGFDFAQQYGATFAGFARVMFAVDKRSEQLPDQNPFHGLFLDPELGARTIRQHHEHLDDVVKPVLPVHAIAQLILARAGARQISKLGSVFSKAITRVLHHVLSKKNRGGVRHSG